MFDFAWSEIALIGVVALVAIGPKDMPVAIKTVAGLIKKARRMAAEFQTHVDELVKEADLQEVRDQFKQIRNFDFRGEIEKAVDKDGSIRSTLSKNPLAEPVRAPQPEPQTRVLDRPENTILAPAPPDAPAFVPPGEAYAKVLAETPAPPPPVAPAFIPPEYAADGRDKS